MHTADCDPRSVKNIQFRLSLNWQPIETAPQDGQEVLGFYLHDDNPRFNEGPWTMAFRKGRWQSCWDGCEVIDAQGDWGTDYKDVMNPTHWMPHPAPPVR